MLGKLLKYDFRSMWKQFSVIWLGGSGPGLYQPVHRVRHPQPRRQCLWRVDGCGLYGAVRRRVLYHGHPVRCVRAYPVL